MKWTHERPIKSGDYWFRYADNKPPQVVRVKGDKVVFRSGKIKDITHLAGEWGGPITPSAPSTIGHSTSGQFPKAETWLSSVGKSIVLLLIGAAIGIFANEPYLSYVGEEKPPEIVGDFSTSPNKLSFMVFPVFRNWGLKLGHIENAKFSPRELHLYPEDVKLNYCNKAPISLFSVLSGKTIVCNFVATIDPQKAIKDPVWFQVSYYGPGGHEILTETYSATPQLKAAENKGGK